MRFLHNALGSLSLILPLFLLCLPTTQALHESDVGVVDWHKQLIGVPLAGALATAPIFHRVGENSIILTATGNNVLAALDSVNGSVVWRHVHEMEDRIAGFYKYRNVVATLSGPGGSTYRTYDAPHGMLIHEKRLHSPESGHLSEPHHLGKFIAFSPDGSDTYVLTNGHTISKIDNNTGKLKWTWSSEDKTALVIYSRVVVAPTAIYAIGVSKSFASFTLHAVALSPVDGDILSTRDFPSSIADAFTGFVTLSGSSTTAPQIAWLEEGSIKSIVLTAILNVKVTTVNDAKFERIMDVGVSDQGHFVAVHKDGSARVMKSQSDRPGLKSLGGFGKSDDMVEPIYAAGVDEHDQVYVSRVYWAPSIMQTKADVFSSHLTTDKSLTATVEIPFDTRTHGILGHVTMDASHSSDAFITRTLITTSTGAMQLWKQGDLQWTREEGLAATVAAEFVELPERVQTSARGDGEESFLSRVVRQIGDAQDFPQYLINFARRFATGSYASPSSPAAASSSEPLARDAFGFRQVIVVATLFGKVYGIDSGDGSILWSRVMGLGWAGEVGGQVQPMKLFVVKTVGDVDSPDDQGGGEPQVVLVAQRRAENSLVDTVLFHINPLSGEEIARQGRNEDDEELKRLTEEEGILQGIDVISGPVVEAYLLASEDTKIVVMLDEYLQVYLYPDNPTTKAAFAKLAPTLHFPLRASTPSGQRRLLGHQVALNPSLSDRYVAYSTWTLSLPEGEDVKTIIPAAKGPVASIGKVLGNRTTLYKYLNPRLFVLLTAPHSAGPAASGSTGTGSEKPTPKTCGVYVVDSAKGTVVYRAPLPAVEGVSCDVRAALAENWLVYHYYDDEFSGEGKTKGWRVVSVELYEGKGIDEKIMSSDMSSFKKESTDVMSIEQSYVFPHAITALATTSTKFGITAKDLIVATRNHQIQSVHRRLLNPRRPNRKVTAEEQEEFLVPYDPALPYDPKRVLSHNYEVANVQRIITAPAILESTSLVFVYGLDMFLTRVAPSNTFDVLSENFNKVQLVLTVAGLAVAIMFTKPMVKRKRLREKWYQ